MKQKIFVPLIDNGGGNVRSHFFMSFLHAFRGIDVHVAHVSDSLAPRARNTAAYLFMESGCEDLLFVDGDIVFKDHHVEMIMGHSAKDFPVIAGLYPKKQKDLSWVINTLPDHVPNETDKPVAVRHAGTGFMRINRSVFERMSTFTESFTNHGVKQFNFFPVGVFGSEYLSEDWAFCDKWTMLGGKVHVDPRIQLQHEGSVFYPLQSPVETILEGVEK